MVEALKQAHGMVYIAARLLNCQPQTIYNRLAKSEKLRDIREEARGLMIDTAELELFKQIRAGEMWAIKFYLTTQGRDRGYADRRELTGPDGGPLQITIGDLAKLAASEDGKQIIDGEFKALGDPHSGSTNGTSGDRG